MDAPATPSAPVPPPPAPAPALTISLLRPPRPKRSARATRLTASALLLLASILLVVSMTVSWWGASLSGGGASATLGFIPGSSYIVNGNFGSGAASGTVAYSAAGLLHIGELYEAVLGVGVLVVLASLAGTALGYLGAIGAFRTRAYLHVTHALTIVALVGAALLPILVAVAQPAAFHADGTSYPGAAGCGTGTTPCTSFWGSLSAGGSTFTWGADVGWYLAVAAAVLLLIAVFQFLTTRNQPYTRDEVGASALPVLLAAEAPPAAPSSSPGSGASGDGAPSSVQPAASYCPRCGNPMTWVAQYSRYYCLTERTYL